MEDQNEYVPISAAAAHPEVQYHPTMVHKLVQRGLIPARWYYGHREVDLDALIKYRAQMRVLGKAKHAIRYRQEAADAPIA